MDRRFWISGIVALALVTGVLGAFALRPLVSPSVGAQVVIANYAFSPNDLGVKVGTTVRWVNMDHIAHTVTFGGHDGHSGAIDSGLMGHMATFDFTFADPGTYEYHCDPHPYMIGTIVVTP